MTMRAIHACALAAVVLGVGANAPRADDLRTVDTAIVLAVDVSGSMDVEELSVQRAGYVDALRHPDMIRIIAAGRLGRIAISHFEWAGDVRPGSILPWRVIEGADDIQIFTRDLEALSLRTSFGTSISRALDYAVELVDAAEFDADAWVIDVSGDGPNNIGAPVVAARDRALDRGITINGLPILIRPSRGAEDLAEYFEQCVIGGPGSFVMPARSADEIAPAIRRKLFRELYGATEGEEVVLAADDEPYDCLIGERMRRERGGQF